jgi:hypothetical protein
MNDLTGDALKNSLARRRRQTRQLLLGLIRKLLGPSAGISESAAGIQAWSQQFTLVVAGARQELPQHARFLRRRLP